MTILEIDTSVILEKITRTLLSQGAHLGLILLKALIIFAIGQILIKIINKLVRKVLEKRKVEPAVRTFVTSLVNVTLIVMLIISVIAALGIQTTSFAALIASVGVGIGMALSGNLSNFAGGIIILLFKPFHIGDYISSGSVSGTVVEIQIFHTILRTIDNIIIYVPNGQLSSGSISNYNIDKRRGEWIIGIDYGEDFDKVKQTLLEVLAKDSRILTDPAPFVEVNNLSDSSVDIVVRAWATSSDYWAVYHSVFQQIYKAFNEKGINFPYPQLTVHNEN